MGRWGLALLVWVLVASAAIAAGSDLDPVAKALATVRVSKPINDERDAGPELNVVKTALRLWAESRFERFQPFVPISDGAFRSATGLDALEARLNADLKNADLTCDGVKASPQRCGDPGPPGYGGRESSRGYIGGVSLQFLEDNRYLLLETTVGIVCGYDQSAYLYEWQDGRWKLIFASETDDYRNKHYEPQEFISVETSPSNVAWNEPVSRPPLVLTLGFSPWCSSNWNVLYARLWRASPTTVATKPLLDISPTLYLGDEPSTTAGRVTDHDLLIQFEGDGTDGGPRTHVAHYAIGDNDRLERIAPVALNPGDFVDEWLRQPWAESVKWSAPREQDKQHRWYDAFHKGVEFVLGQSDEAPLRCEDDPTLWQVSLTEHAGPKNPEVSGYFIVRWMAPYQFTLVDIRNEKSRDCDIADPMRDNVGTLFPFH